jgi:hypothetical protein
VELIRVFNGERERERDARSWKHKTERKREWEQAERERYTNTMLIKWSIVIFSTKNIS